jgi:trk system potassium uptake protein TrkA
MEIIVHGDSNTSKLVGKNILDLDLPDTIIIGALVRDGTVILANKKTVINSGDNIIIFAITKKDIPKIEKMFQVSVGYF